MMGFGPFDHGSSSSSSSSTLSPLAPPFTVDRAAPKLAASPHLLKDPYENWLHLHPPTSNSNSIPPPNPEITPIGTGFGCFGPQPIVSSATHFLPLNKPVFSFGPPELPKSSILEGEPYYPHYRAPISDKNAPTPAGFAFGVSNSGGPSADGRYESGYGKNSSGFGRTAKGKGWWTEAGSLLMPNCSNGIQLGGTAVEDFVAPEEASVVWHGKDVESSAKKAHIGSTCSSSELLDAAYAVFSQDSGPFKMPVSSVLAPTSPLQEELCSRISDSEPIKAWNPFKLNKTPYNKCFAQLDSCTTGLTSSSNATKFSFNMSAPSLGTVASKNVLSRDQPSDLYTKNDISAGCTFTNLNSGGNEMNADTSRISNEMDKNYPKFFGFPLTKTESPLDLKTVRSLRSPSKEISNSKANQLSVFEAYSSVPDTGPCDSIGSSPEMPDELLPAIDSPCWKGPPAPPQVSPFNVVQAPIYLPLMKESEECSDFHKQNQILPENVKTADSLPLKSHEHTNFETGGEKRGSSSFSWNPTSVVELPCADYVKKTGSESFNFGKGIPIQSSVGLGIQETKNGSNPEFETSGVKPLSPEKDVNCMKIFTSESRIEDPGADFNKEAQNASSDFISSAKEHTSDVSCSGVSASNEIGGIHGASDASGDQSPPRLATQILIKMIHNLSELLLSSHQTDENALKEDNYRVLQLVIDNLNSCVSNKFGLRSPMLGRSSCIRKSIDPQEATITTEFSPTGEEPDNILNLRHQQSIHGKEYFCSWNKKSDKFVNGYSSDDIAFEKDNEMTKAIEKAIKENIQEQGEEHHQSILYKNLWIEAEAALCSMKYELRLARMKIELEKNKQHQATVNSIDVAMDSHCSIETAVEKLPNEDFNRYDFLAQKLEESSKEEVIPTRVGDITVGTHTKPQEVKQCGLIGGTNDLESSVLARFKILQNRVENSNSTHKLAPTQHDMISNGERHGQGPWAWCLERQLDLAVEDSPRKVVNLGLTAKRTAWPFITNQLEDGSSELSEGVDVENPGELPGVNNGFCLDVPKQHEASESVLWVANESALQLLANQLSLGGCDSPSSDWEHVLKEELTL